MGLDVKEIVDLGGCNVVFNGVNLGHTDENGTKAVITPTVIEAKVAKFGATPVRKFLAGQTLTVEGVLMQTNFVQLVEALPGATKVTNTAGDSKLTFGKVSGSPILAAELRLSSFIAANTPKYDLKLAKASPIGEWEAVYDGKVVQGYKFKFEALIDEAGGADGSYLATFGDPTVTADTVAPTVSSVVPADAAIGVAVSPGTVVWTISKDLNGNTVNAKNVKVFKDPTGLGATGLEVAGTVALVNAGAATTITFTPAAPLTAATKHIAVLEDVEDLNGNKIANDFYATEFTTA